MVSLAVSPPSKSRRDAAPAGGERGVVHGKYFNFNPLPPPQDVLGNALAVPKLPTHKQPKETWQSRLHRQFARFHLGSQSARTRLRWKLQDTIQSLLSSVSHSVSGAMERRARAHGKVPVVVVRHPYHLRHVLDLLPQLPDEVAAERRFIELVLNRVLRRYGEQMAAVKGSPFSFEHEAKEYFYAGFRMERELKNITAPDERFGALQAIYNAYFHGKNYYYYALLRRERLVPDNKLFMLFSRACYFIARVDWSGQLLDKPNPRSMPTRDEMMFYLQRDKTVLARYRTDAEFQRQIKGVLEAFPD